jgi:serine/threonine-protein kinase RsbW
MALSDSAIGLNASFPAQPPQVAAIRRAVRDVAVACGAGAEVLVRLGLAVSEAATNAVLHAYREQATSGSIHVAAHTVRDVLEVSIGDHGVGMSPRPDSPGLGLGLSLMASEADRFEVHTGEGGGTVVVMRFDLGADRAVPARRRFARDNEVVHAQAGA